MGSAALTFTASYVLYGVVFLLSGGGIGDVRGYYWTTSWPDEDWTKCKSDYECELWATYVVKSDKHECCDGECRETCLSDAAIILLFVVLPCVGCCICVGLITGAIVYAVKVSNKKKSGEVINQPNGTTVVVPGANVQYAGAAPPYPMYNMAPAPPYMANHPPSPAPPLNNMEPKI